MDATRRVIRKMLTEDVGNAQQDLEVAARKVGETRSLLHKRLNQAKSVLRRDLRAKMGGVRFDFENKRLVSQDGKYALQWAVRSFPDQPPGPENQQTNAGVVSFKRVTEAASGGAIGGLSGTGQLSSPGQPSSFVPHDQPSPLDRPRKKRKKQKAESKVPPQFLSKIDNKKAKKKRRGQGKSP